MGEHDISSLYGELKAINAKIDNLTELYNRAAYGEGFARCARQADRLEHIESGLDLAHARISGVKKWLLAVMIAVLSALASFAWDMVSASVKH